MTPTELLASFESFADAPGGIQRLRELVLDLAVKGKLVPQSPTDEPAAKLLSLPGATEGPHPIPLNWTWARLEQLADYKGRPTVDSSDIKKDSWILDLEDIEKDSSRILTRAKFSDRASLSNKSFFKKNDVLYGKLRPYLNKVIVADTDGYCTTEIVPIVPHDGVVPEFLRLSLKSPRFLAHVGRLVYGVKMPRLGTKDAVTSLHPLPPTNEQHRIVAKVEALMGLIDQLAAALDERETARIALRNSSFAALRQSKDAPEVMAAWTRISENVDLLLATRTDVALFRQVIWQLGTSGALTAPVDEGISGLQLLKELDAKRRSLEKSSARHKEFVPVPVTSDETPLHLPARWAWARMAQVFKFIDYRGRTPKKQKSGVRLITAKNVRNGFVRSEPEEYISTADYPKWMTRGFPQQGDILFTTEAPLGNVARLRTGEKIALAQRIINLQPYSPKLNSGFLEMVLLSPAIQGLIKSQATGMTAKGIKASKLKKVPIPISPPREQQRIVCIVDRLSALCDKLEQALDEDLASQDAFAAAAAHYLTA